MNLQSSTISEIARFNTNAISVFHKYGIDFYCKGKYSLAEACAAFGCDVSAVLAELEKISQDVDTNQNFNGWSINKLIEYIIDNHHHYVNKTVPEITGLFKILLADSSVQSVELTRASNLFRLLGNDMKQHMQKEELALFPAIKKLNNIENNKTKTFPIQSLIPVIELEHETSGIILNQIVALQDQIKAADYLSADLSTLISKLVEFESDLIMHIHVENNVLHKKAIELEQVLMVN